MSSEEELIKWYQEQYWAQFKNEQVGLARTNLYTHVLGWLENLSPQGGTLVDVGCGAGTLLSLGQARGWKGIGFDLSIQAVDYARAHGVEASAQGFSPCPLADETADAVTFVNVLDHLREPLEALREAWRILRPGGVLYVRVPNGPFHVRLLRVLSAIGLCDLAVFHLYGFGQAAFFYHLPRLGFEIITVQTAPPSQGYAYGRGERGLARFGSILKRTHHSVYCLIRSLGLTRRCWGPSIEVVARRGHLTATRSGDRGEQ